MKNFKLLVLVTLALSAFSVQAYDFSKADELYEQRDPSLKTVSEARALYNAALKHVEGDELVYAVERLGRLAYYEGDLITTSEETEKRVAIFGRCMKVTELIRPDRLGYEHPAYYYWKTTCFGFWGKAAGELEAMGQLGDFKDALRAGVRLKASKKYAGGGIFRDAGATYSKSKAMKLLGLYDLDKAWKLINFAIKTGPEYYSVYLIKAEILYFGLIKL